jgi:cytochrome c-type biogenesis protein CcmH
MTTFLLAFVVFLALSLAGFLAGGGARRGRLLWLAVPLGASLAGAAIYANQVSPKAEPTVEPPPAIESSTTPMTPLPAAGAPAPGHDAGDMNAMAAKLAARLARNPNDGPGWALLARAYAWLGRYAEADAAFAQAARLKIDDPNLKADWDASRAKAKAGAVPAAGFVAGTVSIAEPLVHTLGAGDTVFVFARAPDGGPPLAVKRFKASELPAQFRLEDRDAMVPGRTVSSVPQVQLVARLSASGNAIRQPGDIETPALNVKPGATGVMLEIGAPRN